MKSIFVNVGIKDKSTNTVNILTVIHYRQSDYYMTTKLESCS